MPNRTVLGGELALPHPPEFFPGSWGQTGELHDAPDYRETRWTGGNLTDTQTDRHTLYGENRHVDENIDRQTHRKTHGKTDKNIIEHFNTQLQKEETIQVPENTPQMHG